MTKTFDVLAVCPYCGYKRHYYTRQFDEMVVLRCKYSCHPIPEGDATNGGCQKKYVMEYKLVAQVQSRGS